MAPSKASIHFSHTTNEAHQLANKFILSHIQDKLTDDPASNHSDFLHQRAEAYDQLISSLSQVDAAKFLTEQRPQPVEPDPESRWLLLKQSAEVLHPLDASVMRIALGTARRNDHRQSATLTEDAVAGLNMAMQQGQVLWKLHSTRVIALSSSEVVKISISLEMDEISNLQYLNSLSLDIPVPRHLGTLKSGERTYLFMSRAPGQTLEELWPTLATLHKSSVQEQLAKMLSSLRSIPPPSTGQECGLHRIGSFVAGTCRDVRRISRYCETPIYTETAFNEFLCRHQGRTRTGWIKMIQSSMRVDHKVVATHADLHPRNIMVAWEGDQGTKIKVTGLIDWQVSGWYPEYWEYVKALSTITPRDPVADWCDYLPTSAIGCWPVEFSLDLLISRWLG
ncbi:hypothetical protein NLG97_g243 [Lecanicillium saksenae]|uniref:Uncharacterized protein n=1 Tax=Lecanicillium saksenae TaxID=468837 RepID=A0ACC1R745_9HYPO|nr:hypothetical protein NLG97_g243 [Lecanicillium saksenae]